MPKWISDNRNNHARIWILSLSLILPFVQISSSHAHEFWLDLKQGRLEVGQRIIGDLKVGEHLQGEPYPYLSNRFEFFRVLHHGQIKDVPGFDGDLPAMNFPTNQPGLHVVSLLSTNFRVTHDDFERFRSYLEDEGLESYAAEHKQRGLPLTGFSERYKRCVKALVQVGPVSDNQTGDRATGLPFELVALNNPYNHETQLLKVQLLFQGQPMPKHQISVFHDHKQVTRKVYQTDEAGLAHIKLTTTGSYLLNAVHLSPVENAPVAWFSHWASLSFKR